MDRRDALALQPSPPRAPRVSVPTAARASAKQAIVAVLQRLWYEHPDEREFLLAEVTAMARAHDLRFPAVMAALTRRGPRMTAPHAQAVFGVEVDAPDDATKKGNHGSPSTTEDEDAEARR